MKIDISRVNLLEKDIEDWLYENPSALPYWLGENPITQWIGRQYALPSGIADLIGLRENHMVVAVEVKNVPINKAAVLQVCRYANDIQHILGARMDYPHVSDAGEPFVEMILIGPSIDDQTFGEARAVGVAVYTFAASVTLDIARMRWSHEYRDAVSAQQSAIAERPEWAIFGLTAREAADRDWNERQRASQTDFAIEQVTDEYDDLMDAITGQPEE